MNNDIQRNILIKRKFIYSLSKEQKELINLINEFRVKNSLEQLKFKEDEEINDFIKVENRKNLYIIGNIFELDKNKYLFIFPIHEFKKKYLNNNNDILNILRNKFINEILIVERFNNEYILVYQTTRNNMNENLDTGVRIYKNTERNNLFNHN